MLVEEPVVHPPELTLLAGAASGMRGDESPALWITRVVPVREADLAGAEVFRLERGEGLAVEPAARSEERRVGKECRCRIAAESYNNKDVLVLNIINLIHSTSVIDLTISNTLRSLMV